MIIADPESRSLETILLVEDDAIIALSEKAMLQRHGYEVIVVHTGEDAVEIASENRSVSLVLMDIDLGSGIDGSVAAERILGSVPSSGATSRLQVWVDDFRQTLMTHVTTS